MLQDIITTITDTVPEYNYSQQEINQELMLLANKIEQLVGTLNPVEIYTPITESLTREKQIFLEHFQQKHSYNPKLEYKVGDVQTIREVHTELYITTHKLEMHTPSNPSELLFIEVLKRVVRDGIATAMLMLGLAQQDEIEVKIALQAKYHGVDSELLTEATARHEYYSQREEVRSIPATVLEHPKYNSNQMMNFFTEAIARYQEQLADSDMVYSVQLCPSATSVDVRDKSIQPLTIFVPTHSRKKASDIVVVDHEISAHVRQSLNGMTFFGCAGSVLRTDDETLYEGLAARYDIQNFAQLFGLPEKTHSTYFVLASHMANQGASFYEVFCRLYELQTTVVPKDPHFIFNYPDYTQQELENELLRRAWLYTYRTFRGHINTNNTHSFAMEKDLGYLRGRLIDEALVNAGKAHYNEIGIFDIENMPLLLKYHIEPHNIPIKYDAGLMGDIV